MKLELRKLEKHTCTERLGREPTHKPTYKVVFTPKPHYDSHVPQRVCSETRETHGVNDSQKRNTGLMSSIRSKLKKLLG